MYLNGKLKIKCEDHMQIALVEYCRKVGEGAESCFHTPNGGKRGAVEAMRFKTMGVRPGIPDLLWLKSRHRYKGLAIELKYGDNKQSGDQKIIQEELENERFFYLASNDLIEMIDCIDWYFGVNTNVEIQASLSKRKSEKVTSWRNRERKSFR